MDVRVGLWRKLTTEELMLLNCGVGEDSWESLGLQGDQSILKEITPGYSLEGMILKLKLQYFGHLMQRFDSLEKTLMLGGIKGRRRRGQRMSWLDGITDSMNVFEWTPGDGDGQGGLVCCDSWVRKESDTTERLNWTELNVLVVSNRIMASICNSNLTSMQEIQVQSLGWEDPLEKGMSTHASILA